MSASEAALIHEISSLRQTLDEITQENQRLKAEVMNLRITIDFQRGTRPSGELTGLRQAFVDAINNGPVLEDMLRLIEAFFPDRVVVLDSARKSARQSKAFEYRREAFKLTLLLVTDYYEAMAAGGIGDGIANQIFGNSNFSARESRSVEHNRKARSLRNFEYKGKMVEMIRHLRFGVKDSVHDTFRLHFHWDAQDMKIVIGHCGYHLDQR